MTSKTDLNSTYIIFMCYCHGIVWIFYTVCCTKILHDYEKMDEHN